MANVTTEERMAALKNPSSYGSTRAEKRKEVNEWAQSQGLPRALSLPIQRQYEKQMEAQKAQQALISFAQNVNSEKIAAGSATSNIAMAQQMPLVSNQSQQQMPFMQRGPSNYALPQTGGRGGGKIVTVDICFDGEPRKLDVYAEGDPY